MLQKITNLNTTLVTELRQWVLRNKRVPHFAITNLLHLLSLYHSELPLDARTLLLLYNIHNILHITDDAREFGVLGNVSAFPFEN